jgi:hypothetical protein
MDLRAKLKTPDMIEGPEAFTRFREAAKKLLSTPKGAAPNPFGKRKKKKSGRKG